MRPTTVQDVMTREVVTALPTTSYKDLVDLMVGEQVSALPVVDRRGTLLGVVSEADLLCREEHGDDSLPAGPFRFAGHRARVHWRKATGLTASALMTVPALSVTEEVTLPEVARRFAATGVRRLCVVDQHDHLVGVIARRDVLSVFLRGDREIQDEVENTVFDRIPHANPAVVRVTVENGVVMLTGRLEYQGDTVTAGRLARQVSGVVAVHNRLDWHWNGARHPAESGSSS
jgi:CBS domain-containing protein